MSQQLICMISTRTCSLVVAKCLDERKHLLYRDEHNAVRHGGAQDGSVFEELEGQVGHSCEVLLPDTEQNQGHYSEDYHANGTSISPTFRKGFRKTEGQEDQGKAGHSQEHAHHYVPTESASKNAIANT